MKKLTSLTAILLSGMTFQASASNLMLDIGNDSINAELNSNKLSNNASFSVGALINENDDKLFSIKALVSGNIQKQQNITAGIGAKLYFADVGEENVQGLGLGGEFAYQLPDVPEIELTLHAYYAPSIALSDDLDYQIDTAARLSYKLIENGAVYLSYRHVKATHESKTNFTIDNGLNFGFQFFF
ncbi:YfaZ family outer membrane protein [Catenovulum maritimum]|uniref:YfaZ family protein n=1 Tax=Catenovulum maritimum TaxID=1513271 RepID=A0A0J8GZK2_9ALTE|nr:YfaZ family outer membrane protein [Catenovulum maritimum]KMT66163.1 hypothetical protein XM47_05170 [Catenovulum maritimum]